MNIIDTITQLPSPLLHHWGYWIILLGAFLETSPFFGLLIPGQMIVIIGGFFVKLKIFDIGDMISIAALGAILGDLIGYILGKKYGYTFISKYGKYVLFKKEYFEKTKQLMQNHTGKTLIIGRFNSLTRAFAPFVAGSSDVPFLRFFIYNIVGGISWAIVFVLIGYIFGSSYEIISHYIGQFIFIALLISSALIYLYKFINTRTHIFNKYHIRALILNIFSLYIFSKMAEDLYGNEAIIHIDIWLNTHIITLWNPLLNNLMLAITTIASPLSLFLFSCILCVVFIYYKKWYYTLLLCCSIGGGLIINIIIKLITHRIRPDNALIQIDGYSFPSGHAMISIIFFSLLIYAFKDHIENIYYKWIFIIVNILLFLLVGMSRVYLNAHWLSDVIAGFGLGLFWLTFLILLFKTTYEFSNQTWQTIQKKLNQYFTLHF